MNSSLLLVEYTAVNLLINTILIIRVPSDSILVSVTCKDKAYPQSQKLLFVPVFTGN